MHCGTQLPDPNEGHPVTHLTAGRTRPSASRPGLLASSLFSAAAAFQLALACGAPWGNAAYGGAYSGVLPPNIRAGSAAASAVYLLLAAVAGTGWVPARWRRRLVLATMALMSVGSVLNLASPSLLEQMLWTPVTVVLAVSLWRTARELESSAGATATAPDGRATAGSAQLPR
jgi:hypothetical protein